MRRRRNFFRSAPRSRAPTPICGRRLRRVDSVMWHGTHPEQSRLINDAVRNLEDGSTFFKTTSRSADTGRPATRLERQQGPAARAFPFGNLNDRSSVCVQVSAMLAVQEATFIWKTRQRWDQTPMAWRHGLVAELPRRRKPQSVAVYFNSPSLLSLDPEQLAQVVRDSFSRRIRNPKKYPTTLSDSSSTFVGARSSNAIQDVDGSDIPNAAPVDRVSPIEPSSGHLFRLSSRSGLGERSGSCPAVAAIVAAPSFGARSDRHIRRH